jgi:hypothetical protein
MPMREECVNFESRTYRNGETVRKCNLDLAPEAPWRCPDDCPAYERRLYDAGWAYGTLAKRPEGPDEVPGLEDGSAAAVLDEAEDILNSVGPDVLAEVQAEQAKQGFFKRVFRRKR